MTNCWLKPMITDLFHPFSIQTLGRAELEDIGSTSDTIWSPAASPTSLIVDGSSPLTDDGLNTQWLLKHEPVFFLPKPIAPPATPDPINISRQSPFHPRLTGACRSCDNIHCQTKGGSLVTTWRMHEHHGKMLVLCNACFMYMRKHEKFRPRSLCIKPKRPHRLRYIGEQDRVCSHCGITKTPSWRFLKQKMLCNACMQYWKRHHTLKSVVSKHSVAN